MENNQFASGNLVDPFQAEQERMKWMNKAQFGLVLVLRGIVFVFTVFLKIMLEVFKNILRAFKILPQ